MARNYRHNPSDRYKYCVIFNNGAEWETISPHFKSACEAEAYFIPKYIEHKTNFSTSRLWDLEGNPVREVMMGLLNANGEYDRAKRKCNIENYMCIDATKLQYLKIPQLWELGYFKPLTEI